MTAASMVELLTKRIKHLEAQIELKDDVISNLLAQRNKFLKDNGLTSIYLQYVEEENGDLS